MARRAKIYKTNNKPQKQQKKAVEIAVSSFKISSAQTQEERAQAAFNHRIREDLLDRL